jgi:hypothetical protein
MWQAAGLRHIKTRQITGWAAQVHRYVYCESARKSELYCYTFYIHRGGQERLHESIGALCYGEATT